MSAAGGRSARLVGNEIRVKNGNGVSPKMALGSVRAYVQSRFEVSYAQQRSNRNTQHDQASTSDINSGEILKLAARNALLMNRIMNTTSRQDADAKIRNS